MSNERPPEALELDLERVRGFIAETAKLYGALNVRILMARGWQEADAKDIVQHAFRTMMKPEGKSYPDSLATLLLETGYDPEHKRARGLVRLAVSRSAMDAIRRKADGPFSTAASDSSEVDELTDMTAPSDEEGGEALRHISEQNKQRLVRQIHFWFDSVCHRFDYAQHWKVYVHEIVEGKTRGEIAQKLDIAPKTVSNKALEGRLLRGVLGRLLMALDRTASDNEPSSTQKVQSMRLSIETLLLDEDTLMTVQMKELFRGLLSGEFSVEFGRNNRPNVKQAQVNKGQASSAVVGTPPPENVSRATLALASMVLGVILHVTKNYTGASAHGNE